MPQGFGHVIETRKAVRFGLFAFLVNKVMLIAGGSYTLAGVTGRDGELRMFKGKALATPQDLKTAQADKKAKQPVDHIVLLMRAKNRDNEEYLKVYEMAGLNKDPKWKVLGKSLVTVFGENYPEIVKPVTAFKSATWFPAKLEEVPTGGKWTGQDGTEQAETAPKFIEQFADEKAMRAAEETYFAQFGSSNGNGETIVIPPGTPMPDVYNKALQLWQLCKGDEAKFAKLITADVAANPTTSIYAKQDVLTLLLAIKSDVP